jgi:hypothetical protein
MYQDIYIFANSPIRMRFYYLLDGRAGVCRWRHAFCFRFFLFLFSFTLSFELSQLDARETRSPLIKEFGLELEFESSVCSLVVRYERF